MIPATRTTPHSISTTGKHFSEAPLPVQEKKIELDIIGRLLARKQRIDALIIVAIHSTAHRSAEYSPSIHGKHYIKFLTTELKPIIDANFRTKQKPEHTAVLGFSLGALIALFTVKTSPHVFGKVACMSTCWFDIPDDFLLQNIRLTSFFEFYESNEFPNNLKIYLDAGTNESHDPTQIGMIEMQREIVTMLKLKGYVENINLQSIIIENGKHAIEDWNKRIYHPLLFLFGENTNFQRPPQDLS